MKLKNKVLLSMISVTALLFLFQNCSNTGFMQGRDLASEWANALDPFFAYYYASPPVAYFDGVIIVPTDADPKARFADVGFIGSLSMADGSHASSSYKLELRKNDGSRVCPQQTGTLGTQTRIEFECVTSNLVLGANEWLVAWIQFTSGGKTYTLEKPFR